MATDISILARREAEAETRKGKADLAWRAAWWRTTLALGAIPIEEKKRVGEAQALVREITDQKVGYVKDRTRTGRAFGLLEQTETLPPRIAMAVVGAGVEVTTQVVRQMIKADKDPEMTLRRFTAELTGKGWADTPEGASEETIEKIVTAQPEAVARAAGRQMASNPAFAKGVTEAMGTAAKDLPTYERDQLTSTVVGASVGVTEKDRKDLAKTVERTVKEHEAREEATPPGIRALKVLPVMWDVDGLLEKFETAPRDDESVAVMQLFAQWAESMARRAKMIANGDFLPPTDDEFTAGIEAILGDV